MDKKLIIGIVVLILIALVGGIFVMANMNNKTQNDIEKLEQKTTNSNINTNNKSEIQNKENTKKTLVIYYSRSGNTKQIADYIGEKTNADVIRLETVRTYPSNYDEMLDTAKEEQKNGDRPELKNKNINI